MKRRLFKLAWFLLLGAIINVAVTWGLALTIDTRTAPATTLYRRLDLTESSVGGTLSVTRYSKPGAICLVAYAGHPRHALHGMVPEGIPEVLVNYWARKQMLPWTIGDVPWPARSLEMREVDARGWPLLSFWCVSARIKSNPELGRAEGGIQLPVRWATKYDRQWSRITTLPYWPIGLGLAINTLFYAAILWLITLGPFTARRFIRNKRGHCIKCGYDLRGTTSEIRCPECGYGRESEA